MKLQLNLCLFSVVLVMFLKQITCDPDYVTNISIKVILF